MVRVVLTGTRDCEIAAANGHHANPAILRLHPTYRSGAKRRTGTPLQTRLASMTEAAKHHRSVSLEEPGARVKHEPPGHPSRDVFRQAVSRTASCDSTVSRTAKLLSDRLRDGHGYFPAPRDARAVVRLTASCSPETP